MRGCCIVDQMLSASFSGLLLIIANATRDRPTGLPMQFGPAIPLIFCVVDHLRRYGPRLHPGGGAQGPIRDEMPALGVVIWRRDLPGRLHRNPQRNADRGMAEQISVRSNYLKHNQI
jgi:hypothetical protein